MATGGDGDMEMTDERAAALGLAMLAWVRDRTRDAPVATTSALTPDQVDLGDGPAPTVEEIAALWSRLDAEGMVVFSGSWENERIKVSLSARGAAILD